MVVPQLMARRQFVNPVSPKRKEPVPPDAARHTLAAALLDTLSSDTLLLWTG